MENLSTISYLDELVDVIKSIDTTDLSDDVDKESISKVIEEQKSIAQASAVKSEELFNSLLQKAFNGELV